MSVALLVLPEFLLIALGQLLRRGGGFAQAFWPGVERLVYFVLFPALLFRSLAVAPLDFRSALPVIATTVGFTLVGIVLPLVARRWLRLPEDLFAACYQCAFRINTYLALAIASRVAGERGLALVSLLLGFVVPLVNVAAVAMLVRGRATSQGCAEGEPARRVSAEGSRARAVARELARNPLILACAAGLAWNLLGLPRPAVALRVVELLAAAALPLGLLAVGAGLVFRGAELPARAIVFWSAVKLLALPAVALLLARAFALDATETLVVLAMAAVPTAPSAYVLAVQLRAPGAPVALLITSGTLASMVTLTLWLALAGASP